MAGATALAITTQNVASDGLRAAVLGLYLLPLALAFGALAHLRAPHGARAAGAAPA